MRAAACALLLSVAAAAQTTAPAPASPVPATWPTAQFASTKDPSVQKALQILNDMIRALGGDAYLNVQDLKSEGRTYGFYHGKPNSMSIEFWRFWQWPDKERIELTKQRDVVELFIGDSGYEITYKGTATQEPKDMEDYLRRRNHSLEWVIRKWLPTPGTMVLYDGTAMVEQNLADQVTVLSTSNDSVTLSIDPRTHLPVKTSYSWRDSVDRQMDDESEVYANYKVFQGIQTPLSTVRNRNGEMTNQRFITSVTYNSSLPPTLFETKGLTYNPGKKPPK
ncbi:MAG: hypothetical protein WA655_20605 [Candidatus Korobacteraceae bacterium]